MRFPFFTAVSFVILAALGVGAQDEPPPGPAPLPPVRVRLASLGSPRQVTIRSEAGIRLAAASGEAAVEAPPGMSAVTIAAAGDKVALGDARYASLRVEGAPLTLTAEGVKRIYPGALLVTASKRGLSLANECGMEEYTEGVLAGECPALFHPEAIKASAVAARSYSYRKAFLNKMELCDTVHCQVFLGSGSVRPSIRDAAAATAGLCALYDGEVIDAVYSSDCGGCTEANEDAWKGVRPIPYLRAVEDAPEPGGEPYCAVNRAHSWKVALSHARLRALLGRPEAGLGLDILETTASGRARRLRLGRPAAGEGGEGRSAGRLFTGEEWRRLVGATVVRSLRFDARRTEAGIVLSGRGYGHGVGLCQFGSNGMARQGAAYDAILRHYYRGVELAPAPDVAEARARRQGSPARAAPPALLVPFPG